MAKESSPLIVFQALDAAGKDSTIEHVMSGVNPQGVDVVSFRQPSSSSTSPRRSRSPVHRAARHAGQEWKFNADDVAERARWTLT